MVANEEEIGGQVLSWEQTAIKKNLSTKQPTIVLKKATNLYQDSLSARQEITDQYQLNESG